MTGLMVWFFDKNLTLASVAHLEPVPEVEHVPVLVQAVEVKLDAEV